MAASLAEIIILGLLFDWIFRRLRFPGLVGMLFVGIMLGPHVLGYLDANLLAVSADLRMIALIVILLRVGFELSRQTLHRVGGRVLMLAFIPATMEGIAITFIAPLFLPLSYLQSAVLGSVLAAVSPAVVVPLMIKFMKERRGAAKDIPSMIMAATSIDDIYVIVIHSIIIGLYVGHKVSIPWQIAGIPLSLCLGGVAGLVVGTALYRLFDYLNPRATKRVLVILAASILLVRLEYILAEHVPFAGLVGAMAIGFVILEKREHMAHEISARLGKIWVFAEIILFSMVGAQVNLEVAWKAGAMGLAVICIGLLARGMGVWMCLLNSKLNIRERFFVVISFSPKATVQAAIGAAPLMAMRSAGMDAGPGEIILAVAVLSIITTAPTGSWAISFLGKRVLKIAPESFHEAQEAAIESNPD